MRARLVTSLRTLTWCGIVFLAVLSLLPGEALTALSLSPMMQMVRAVLSGPAEHFVAYAAVAAIAIAAYDGSLVGPRIIAALCVYAGALEYIRHFSPDRHPSVAKFAGSALGALCGGLVVILLLHRYYRGHLAALPSRCDSQTDSTRVSGQ
jgi:VanZ family protein